MTALDQRSTAELRRLRDRATNETIRELLNAELATRWREVTPKGWTILNRFGKYQDLYFDPQPGQP